MKPCGPVGSQGRANQLARLVGFDVFERPVAATSPKTKPEAANFLLDDDNDGAIVASSYPTLGC